MPKLTRFSGNSFMISIFAAVTFCFFLTGCSGPEADDTLNLEKGFLDPPASASPRVWWHWMNGNISVEGIRADLNWMHRTGIGGFQNFDAGLATPQIVPERFIYMTPGWKKAFLFTTKLADSLGLEMAIAGSPGWSESGGPWVTPVQAMKKLVWTETRIEGGKPFKGILPKPPSTTGRFQNIPGAGGFTIGNPTLPEFYADAAVVACRIPDNDLSFAELKPFITTSGGKVNSEILSDGDLDKSFFLPAAKVNEKSWICVAFEKPIVIRSLTFAATQTGLNFPGFGGPGFTKALEYSEDGADYKTVFEIPSTDLPQGTFTFAPITARFFRVTFKTPPPPPASPELAELFSGLLKAGPAVKQGMNISELILSPAARVNRFEDKAAFTSLPGLYDLATSPVESSWTISPKEVIDLTNELKEDGSLEWAPPEGKWIILRFGYSLTGHQNSPASPEATGLEVDKLNAGYVKDYFENYLNQYKDATGGLMGKRGLQYVITDSWEAGVQNWTDSMMTEFSRRRGYEMLPWLPALTGHIVGSAESTDRFLWDFRKTISDLTAENHYDQLTNILHERGMGRYTESHEGGRAFIADGMEVKRKADIPMSATWVPGGFSGDENNGVANGYKADVRESASVAHLYGQNLVAAESMTAIGNTWAYAPERLKPTADMELACGLNRFVIHTSVHQPVMDKVPGLGLGPFGQWFTRNETWAEYAKPWISYLARSSYMLQQGKFVADILYYYGEDNNITALYGNKLPDIPEGYNYDFINSDALLNLLSVKDGQIVTPSGMKYRVLMLDPNSAHMPLAVLLKIRDLVKEGAVIVGERPVDSPSLADDQVHFQAVADMVWNSEGSENKVGKGKVFSGKNTGDILKEISIAPDFEYTKPDELTKLLFVHRSLAKADLYWINNRNSRDENLEAWFRIDGKVPEIWHPETGQIEQASYEISGGRTKVSLRLVPDDAVFVVFRKKAGSTSQIIPAPEENSVAVLTGSWNVIFQADRGAPAGTKFDSLVSFTASSDPGIKYFSGTATYEKSFEAPESWLSQGKSLWLDLGVVKNLAEVTLNGKNLGVVWKKPFRVEITDAIKGGNNDLVVKVTNLWVNRLIGDQQPGITKKYTYTTQAFYKADSPLLPSGLLGPARIIARTSE